MVADPREMIYRVGETFLRGKCELTQLLPVEGGPVRWRGVGVHQAIDEVGNIVGSVQFHYFVDADTPEQAFAGVEAAVQKAGDEAGAKMRQHAQPKIAIPRPGPMPMPRRQFRMP